MMYKHAQYKIVYAYLSIYMPMPVKQVWGFRGDKLSEFMKYAIQLAQMVKGQTGVNPPVGSVVVKDGRIVGLGAHLKQGEKHAEVQALDMAQDKAKAAPFIFLLNPVHIMGQHHLV